MRTPVNHLGGMFGLHRPLSQMFGGVCVCVCLQIRVSYPLAQVAGEDEVA